MGGVVHGLWKVQGILCEEQWYVHMQDFGAKGLFDLRKSIRYQLLVLDRCRCILDNGHKSHMGHKNTTNVASEPTFDLKRGSTAVEL